MEPFDVITTALRTDDRFVQAEAARLLGELGNPRAVPPLLDYVRYSRWHSKTTGFHALAQIGDRSVCDVIRPLVDLPNCSDDWYWYGCRGVRTAAAVALLALGDEGGAGFLRELAEKNDDVLYAWFGPAVLRLPDDPPAAAEIKACITVEALAGPGARSTRRTEPGIVTMVAEALGVIGTEDACAALRDLLTFRSRYTRGQAALSLMAAQPTAEHADAVAELAESDPADFARVQAALALAKAGRSEHVSLLTEKAEGAEDWFDRAVALRGLGELARAEDFGFVAAQLDSEHAYVRQCAVEALEGIDTEQAETPACERLRDRDVRVRMQAAKLLAGLEGGAA